MYYIAKSYRDAKGPYDGPTLDKVGLEAKWYSSKREAQKDADSLNRFSRGKSFEVREGPYLPSYPLKKRKKAKYDGYTYHKCMSQKLFQLLRQKIASDQSFRFALHEELSRYEEGENVPLEDLPEEFQEMNRNPPESVKRVRKEMIERMSMEEMGRYEEGEDVPLSELPEELQENVKNPPPSVKRLRKKMIEKMARDFLAQKKKASFRKVRMNDLPKPFKSFVKKVESALLKIAREERIGYKSAFGHEVEYDGNSHWKYVIRFEIPDGGRIEEAITYNYPLEETISYVAPRGRMDDPSPKGVITQIKKNLDSYLDRYWLERDVE